MVMTNDDDLLDVVDDQDRIIGTALKSVCHQRGLLHRSVFVFLFIDGKLALQRRSSKKDVRPNKLTASATGHVVSGESYAAAAKRELREELGVDADLKPILSMRGPYEMDRELIMLFEGCTSNVIHPNIAEIDSVLFLALEDVYQHIYDPTFNWGDTFKKVFLEYMRLKWGRECFKSA
jgi:isopentenyldiphosphate isomerase